MKKIFTSPFDLVSKALEISTDQLNEDSAMGQTPNWDSLNHIIIIGDLEENYKIQIPDKDIENYTSMKAIIDLYNKLSESSI